MNLKAIKDEYQDSLNLLTDILKVLNSKRIELNQINEEKDKSIEAKNQIDKKANKLYQSVEKIKNDITKYESLKESFIRELHFLSGKVSEKELSIANHKNLTTAEKNKIEALKQLRINKDKDLKKIKEELEKEFIIKEQKDKEILLANKKLEEINQEIEEKSNSLAARLSELNSKENELKKFELALQNEKNRLDSIVTKLKDFANKNSLSLNI